MPPQAASDAGFAVSSASAGAADKIAFDSVIADAARPAKAANCRCDVYPPVTLLFDKVTSWSIDDLQNRGDQNGSKVDCCSDRQEIRTDPHERNLKSRSQHRPLS